MERSFYNLIKKQIGRQELEDMIMRYRLADVCLSQVRESETPNVVLFSAITHLAQVQQLHLCADNYAQITGETLERRLDTTVLVLAQQKLEELSNLITQRCGGKNG